VPALLQPLPRPAAQLPAELAPSLLLLGLLGLLLSLRLVQVLVLAPTLVLRRPPVSP
jgi:hypothetical protein